MAYEASTIDVRGRVAWWARQQQPSDTSKWLQAQLDVSESTADRILAGAASWPVIGQMCRRFGWSFAHFVLEAVCGPAPTIAGVTATIAEAKRLAAENQRALEDIHASLNRAANGGILGLAGGSAGDGAGASDPLRHVVARQDVEADASGRDRRP